LALPAWFWFAFFFAVPVLWILFYSFGYKPDLYRTIATNHLNFHQYALAASSTFFQTYISTLRISLLGTFICFLIAFPFAYWLAVRVRQSRRPLVLSFVLIPFWTNFLVRTIGWRIILSPSGLLAGALHSLHLHPSSIQLLDTRGAVQLGVVYNYLPLMILPIYVALDRLDPSLREASKDLGAGRIRTLIQVTIPLVMPGIIAGLILVFIPLSGDFITATVLGGAKGNMAGQMVYDQFLIAQNWALGSAMAVELILVIIMTVAIFGSFGWIARKSVKARRRITIVLQEEPLEVFV
jgi:spermidine/putrescine transport system permease protein